MVDAKTLTHLERLEAESIHILREVVSEAEKPVMLYSVGKDSAVMLHLARKAWGRMTAAPAMPTGSVPSALEGFEEGRSRQNSYVGCKYMFQHAC